MEREYGIINYIELDCLVPWIESFAFIDTTDYAADRVFINNELRVRFGREFGKDGCPYIVIFCKIHKRDRKRFLKSMADLERKIILGGHNDYPAFCRENLQGLRDGH